MAIGTPIPSFTYFTPAMLAFGTGALRSQAGLAVVASLLEVEIVIDQIGINLHDESKEKAQYHRKPIGSKV